MKILTSPAEAVTHILSGQRVFVHGAAATPNTLLKALAEQYKRLENVEIIHLHTEGPAHFADKKFAGHFRMAHLFVGPNYRPYLDYDRIDYLPFFLSEIPQLFRSRRRPLDVALLHVSPPDAHGFCTLGTSVDVARAAAETADLVIAQINKQMPRVHGDGFIHVNDIDYAIEVDEKLPEHPKSRLTEVEKAIGRNVAELIDDGCTLQAGIGSVPDAVMECLKDRRHLGLHTEMWSNGALELIKCGAIDNSRKKVHPGKCVSSFLNGNKELYDFVNDNPSVVQLDVAYVNDPAVIRRNPKVVAINSAVEIDLTGQVCADSVGPRIISGVGGQMDFMRGASLSPQGKPIIAITSRAKSGTPRIVAQLKPGSGVVTTRFHVHYVATEFGVADLYGKTLSERTKALIAIAHPEDREKLARDQRELLKM